MEGVKKLRVTKLNIQPNHNHPTAFLRPHFSDVFSVIVGSDVWTAVRRRHRVLTRHPSLPFKDLENEFYV